VIPFFVISPGDFPQLINKNPILESRKAFAWFTNKIGALRVHTRIPDTQSAPTLIFCNVKTFSRVPVIL
jgi:hypothetical protein